MDAPSKKRRFITLEEKKKIIKASEERKSMAEVGKQFGLSKETVQTILREKAAILSAINEGGEAKWAKLRAPKHEDLEEAVLRWVKSVRSQNVAVTGPLLMEKAIQLAENLGIEGFKASAGWLGNFKHHHSITLLSNQGEAGEIDMATTGSKQYSKMKSTSSLPTLSSMLMKLVFFWKLLPNKALAFKGERCTSGKKSKERITVLVRSNISGTEKLPLLVIGKSAKPRCFKNKEPPVEYKANKKAWMIADIFEEWLKQWDQKLKRQNRKVLLFLDNFSGHSNEEKPKKGKKAIKRPAVKLDQITLKFFPPNTTAASQPCDQGIIENVKVHCRRFLLHERISAIDDDKQYQINLLHAL